SALGTGNATVLSGDRLLKEAVNLSAHSTAANAADVNDLRIVLGYSTWNLYGISYGTRLALVTMRSFPKGVRSVILDSTFPFGGSISGNEHTRNSRRAFETLFSTCAADAWCNASYPNLRGA